MFTSLQGLGCIRSSCMATWMRPVQESLPKQVGAASRGLQGVGNQLCRAGRGAGGGRGGCSSSQGRGREAEEGRGRGGSALRACRADAPAGAEGAHAVRKLCGVAGGRQPCQRQLGPLGECSTLCE